MASEAGRRSTLTAGPADREPLRAKSMADGYSNLPMPSSAVKGAKTFGSSLARPSMLPRQSMAASRGAPAVAGMGYGAGPSSSQPRQSSAQGLPSDDPSSTPHLLRGSLGGRRNDGPAYSQGRQSMAGSVGRQSMAPTPSGRRSIGRQSMAPTSMPSLKGAVPVDPRPIRTKVFGEAMKERVFTYLQATGFTSPNFTLKNVQNPTQSQAMQMFRHIYHHAVEPRFKFSDEPKKEADEVLSLMAEVKYPLMGELSKTKIASAGSQQNWPVVCAMFDWLVCLADQFEDLSQTKYGAGPLENPVGEEEAEDDIQLQFFPFLWKCYEKFWQNEDTFPEELAELEAYFQEKNASIIDENRDLAMERDRLAEELGQYTRVESPLKKEQTENDVLRNDLQKFQRYQDDVLAVKLDKNKRIVERLGDAQEESKAEYETRKRERDELQLKVASQEVSSDEWEAMLRERDQLARQLGDLQTAVQNNRSTAAQRELACTNLQSRVEAVLQDANELANQHSFLPYELPNGQMIPDVDVVANEESMLTGNVSVTKDLKPLLQRKRERSMDRLNMLKEEQDALDVRYQSLTDENAQIRSEIQSIEASLAELDNHVKQAQETMEWTQAFHTQKQQGLKADSNAIYRSINERRAFAANRLEVLKRAVVTAKKNDEAYRKAMYDDILAISADLLELKEMTGNALGHLMDTAERAGRNA